MSPDYTVYAAMRINFAWAYCLYMRQKLYIFQYKLRYYRDYLYIITYILSHYVIII